jgi:HAD superfamily hydrolase (TIGR01459 family)
MTRHIESLQQILDEFDVAVLDQWGVLHNGSRPYPHAIGAMEILARAGKEIFVASNSGKRASLNLARIGQIGLPIELISKVITSGEALWEDLHKNRLTICGRVPRSLYAICGKRGDATAWAEGCQQIELSEDLDSSVDAIMLMGLADRTPANAYDDVFQRAVQLKIPLVCSNPDKASPRAGGLVISPGALADRFHDMGGQVVWYGKPHANIYRAVQRNAPSVSPGRFLMVGDSLEHDIAGAQEMGFSSAFVRGGIHANDFSDTTNQQSVGQICDRLVALYGVETPDFSLPLLA